CDYSLIRNCSRSQTAPAARSSLDNYSGNTVKCRGISLIERHELAGYWMLEIQVSRVQGKPANGIEASTIVFVADDRMPGLREMHADLMLAAGFKTHLQHGSFSISLDHMDVGYCCLSEMFVRR